MGRTFSSGGSATDDEVTSVGRFPVVAHSVFSWLPLTMTWVYHQIRYAPVTRAVVLADTLENEASFAWDPVFTASWRERQAWRVANRMGRRFTPTSFHEAVAEQGVEVLHSHFGHRGWYDLPLARKHDLPHVVTYYGYDLTLLPTRQQMWRERYRELFRSADLFLCEGPHMADTLEALGCPEERVAVQRLGVDLDRFRYEPRQPPGDGVVRILIAGAFRQKKGIPLALEAVANLRDSHKDLKVTVVGDAGGQLREQAEKAAILDVVERRHLEQIVRFLGFQPYERLLEEAYRHHVFLSPSLTADDGDAEGGAPVSIIEMAATGMPIVSTRHCDIPQVVVEGTTGSLAAEGDVDDLTERLRTVVWDPDSWRRMGEAGRRHIERSYDVRILTRQLADRYAALAGS